MVESIKAWRNYRGGRQFLVKFQGYDNPSDDRWIHEGHLEHCQEIVDAYLSTNPAATNKGGRKRK